MVSAPNAAPSISARFHPTAPSVDPREYMMAGAHRSPELGMRHLCSLLIVSQHYVALKPT